MKQYLITRRNGERLVVAAPSTSDAEAVIKANDELRHDERRSLGLASADDVKTCKRVPSPHDKDDPSQKAKQAKAKADKSDAAA